MRRRMPTSRYKQRAAVLVEMVLVTPILLLLMVGTAEITRIFIDHNTLTKAARTGVRYVAANGYQGTTGVVVLTASLISETQNLVVFGNVSGTGTPVLPGLAATDVIVTDLGSNNIQVTVDHAITGMLGSVIRSFSGGGDISLLHTLEATVTMRAL